MRLKKLKHSNNKVADEIIVDFDLVFSVYYSQNYKATVIMSVAGAMLPVAEDLETVMSMWDEGVSK